jgi:predicted kinase
LTDSDHSEHLATLRSLTAVNGPIDADAPTATRQQSKNYSNGRLTAPRARLHKQIIREFFAENDAVIRDRQVLVMAGPPGAGKSSARRERIPEAEEKHWRFIDPDDFKTRLLRKLRESGEYDEIVPPAVKSRIDAGDRFAPGELAALVHEESSELAREAATISLERGERVVIDGVHGSKVKLLKRFQQLAEQGYTSIEIIAVDGPREVTRARVINRWEKGYAAFQDGTDDAAYQARYVPEHITDSLYVDDDRFSACARAVAMATKGAPEGLTVRADVYYVDDVNAAGAPWRTYRKDLDGFAHEKLRDIPRPQPRTAPAGASSTPAGGDSTPGAGEIYVAGYERSDGTVVPPHTRVRPAGH